MLPPGQISRLDFPRFGLTPYAERYPARPNDRSVEVTLLSGEKFHFADALDGLPRVAMDADFHCVTTWSKLDLRWGGVRFSAFFEQRIAPLLDQSETVVGVILRAQDGYRTTLLLEDLLADDVLLANELNGVPLSVEHGAPLRLVAPRHYGYKSLKHLCSLEFCAVAPVVKHGPLALLDHPRARVGLEERGQWLPGWFLRHLYRLFVKRTAEQFRRGMLEYRAPSGEDVDA